MISEKKETYLSAFIPVISLCISVEMIVEIIIMPIYDFKLGGNLTYPY
jgi:hypothetical protein